jgi:hypothetical protein
MTIDINLGCFSNRLYPEIYFGLGMAIYELQKSISVTPK